MDFVYICRTGENEELRYSIRSVVQNFPKARIWVVGGKPGWYTGHHIPVSQSRNKYTNVSNNIIAACSSKEISKSFVLMNDDFFILKRFDLKQTFHGGLLLDKINRYNTTTPSSGYVRKLSSTYDQLLAMDIENPIDYDLHVPLVLEKDKMEKIIYKYPNLLWRSLYGNIYGLGGQKIKDVKIYSNSIYSSRSSEINDESTFVSTEDYSFSILIKTDFKNRFPNPNNNEMQIVSSASFG